MRERREKTEEVWAASGKSPAARKQQCVLPGLTECRAEVRGTKSSTVPGRAQWGLDCLQGN